MKKCYSLHFALLLPLFFLGSTCIAQTSSNGLKILSYSMDDYDKNIFTQSSSVYFSDNFQFSMIIENSDTLSYQGVAGKISIYDSTNTLLTYGVPINTQLLLPGHSLQVRTFQFSPTSKNKYTVVFETFENYFSTPILHDVDSVQFEVTDSLWSTGSVGNHGSIGYPELGEDGFGVGAYFRMPSHYDDREVKGVIVHLAEHTVPGGFIETLLYKYDGSPTLSLLGFTTTPKLYAQHQITAADTARGYCKYYFTPTAVMSNDTSFAYYLVHFGYTWYGQYPMAFVNDTTETQPFFNAIFHHSDTSFRPWFQFPIDTSIGGPKYCNAIATQLIIARPPFNTVEENEEFPLLFYPNPAADEIQIDLNGVEGIQSFDLVDMNGKIILEHQINENSFNLNVSSIPNGTYLLYLIREDQSVITQKITIQH